MKRRGTPVFALAAAATALGGALMIAACEVDICNVDSSSAGGICLPKNPALAGFMPVCGNGICERRGKVKETALTCPADCDGGYFARAILLDALTVDLYNKDVANKSWPNGAVNASGACRDGGNASITGTAGSFGNDNFHMLSFQTNGCTLNYHAQIGILTSSGGPFTRSATFNTVQHTSSTHIQGNATFSGVDGSDLAPSPTHFGPQACAFDVTYVSTGTVGATTGSICGKPLRRIIYDDMIPVGARP